MKKNSKKRSSSNFIYYPLLIIVKYFVFIGEITQTVISIPSKLIKNIQRNFAQSSTKNKSYNKRLSNKKIKKKVTVDQQLLFVKKLSWRLFKRSRKGGISILRFIGILIVYAVKKLIWMLKKFLVLLYYIVIFPFRFTYSLITPKLRFFILGFVICFLIISYYQFNQFIKDLPSPTEIGKINFPLSSHIYDRNGKLLYEIYHDQNRTPITLKELPKYVSYASIAIEDKDFFRHSGVSISSGVLRAAREILLRHNLQGGSTITQQLVKTALLTPERTIQRKIKEIVLAIWTEKEFNKNQILEMYLNQVPYGGSSYGIEEAAETYFSKNAKDLTIAEAALLAGLPQAPSVYSPFVNPDLALNRRNDVLQKMYEQGYITKDQYDEAIATKVEINPPQTPIKAPHFVFYVKSNLEKQFGIREVEEGGLQVTSTLDLDLQQKIEQILKEEIGKIQGLNVSNGAVLVTNPKTGEILAMAGSVDYFAPPSGAVNLTTSLRQPGSSVKPIMYSLALERGFTAASLIDDSPISYRISDDEVYRPVNYDGKFHGRVTLRIALANSFNIPAVKVNSAIGSDNFAAHARRMGLENWTNELRFGLPLTLGSYETTMVNMATAFGVFANQGDRVDLTDYVKITDTQGETIDQLNPRKTKVLNTGVAYIISDILSDNFARQLEFGPHSALEIPGYKVSVKTGTTNDLHDNWTIGYTPDYLVATWVGNNDNTPMNQALVSGITGAAPIWNRVMSLLLKQNEQASHDWFQQPDDVVEKTCYFGRPEYFIKGTENTANCSTPVITPPPGVTLSNTNNSVPSTYNPVRKEGRGRKAR